MVFNNFSLIIFVRYILFFAQICLTFGGGKRKQPTSWDGKEFFPLVEEPNPDFLPHPPKSESYKSKDATIFVGIAAFRDTRCPKTLYNLFTKAENPNRVFIGLVQQNGNDDIDCVEKYCELMGYTAPNGLKNPDDDRKKNCPYFNQIRINRVTHLLARGPTFGRHLQIYLLQDEEFCMQIDSHMDFMDHWDTLNLEHWGMAVNEYAVLTTYVHRIEDLNRNINGRWEVPNICKLRFVDGGLPRNGDAFSAFWLTRPKLGSLWAAGFSFMKCHGERQVPYDPQLPGIFDGEEFSRSARLWTRGYDFYTPHRPVVVHDYNKPKDYNPQSWQKNGNDKYKKQDKERSRKRIFTLLRMQGGNLTEAAQQALGKYGLGKLRTLEQYQTYMGVDLWAREMKENKCGTLDWVLFEEDLETLELYSKPLKWDYSGALMLNKSNELPEPVEEENKEIVTDERKAEKKNPSADEDYQKVKQTKQRLKQESPKTSFLEQQFTIRIPMLSVFECFGIMATLGLACFLVRRRNSTVMGSKKYAKHYTKKYGKNLKM